MKRSPTRTVTSLAFLGVLCGALTGCRSARLAASADTPGTQQPRHFAVTTALTTSFDYQLFLPQDYSAGGNRLWPLIVFLHGAGERGTNLAAVTTHGPPKLVRNRPDFPFIVVSPQCPENRLWEPSTLDLLLDDVLARYAVDPARVYPTGLSMGGNGTWAWATASPERFAAAAPICGWGDPVRVWLSSGPRRDALARLPIWAFHGARDNVVPPSGSQDMIAAFERIGNHPRLTLYPEASHDSWTRAYADPSLFDWFLQHRRP